MHTPLGELKVARLWAKERLRAGAEPPWTYYRLMQLIEAIDALESGAQAVTTTDHSPQSDERSGKHPRQEGKIYRLDDARSRPTDETVQMPT